MKKTNLTNREKQIVSKLLAYKRKYEGSPEYAFTDCREAERLVKGNWVAFLFGVIFDQMNKAEVSWNAPLRLKKRLGHLNIYRIAEMNQGQLANVFSKSPAIHWLSSKMASWIISASKKVADDYNGKVENIWNDTKDAKEIIRRFDDFDGIGQKKATMATNFLRDYFKIPITGRENIDISVDVMIRRIFKRLGLVKNSASDCTIIKKAQVLRPSFPGELDYPSWDIGRYWCLPKEPCYYEENGNSVKCPLMKECPSARK